MLFLTNSEEATVEDIATAADAREVLELIESVKQRLSNPGETVAATVSIISLFAP